MALAPSVAGAIRPSQVITWADDAGVALNLSGATITGKIRASDGTSRNIAGALSITNAASGIFTWDYAAGDVATAGLFAVQFTAAFASGQTPARSIIESWLVYEAIV
jgi:hypothetical protein